MKELGTSDWVWLVLMKDAWGKADVFDAVHRISWLLELKQLVKCMSVKNKTIAGKSLYNSGL